MGTPPFDVKSPEFACLSLGVRPGGCIHSVSDCQYAPDGSYLRQKRRKPRRRTAERVDAAEAAVRGLRAPVRRLPRKAAASALAKRYARRTASRFFRKRKSFRVQFPLTKSNPGAIAGNFPPPFPE